MTHGRIEDVLVVGASVAGVTLARTLRALGFDGRLRLLDREAEEPYDKPPLSKADVADVPRLLTREEAAALDVELLLGRTAVGLDTVVRCLELGDGEVLDYGTLVIATGVRARPSPWEGPRLHVLRTLADARRLHAALAAGGHVVVVGAGFIGAEIASTAVAAGCAVTLVDTLDNPAAPVVGELVGEHLLSAHRAAGVRLRLGTSVASLWHEPEAVGLRLATGEELRADHVIVGIGAEVDTEWLDGSGLVLDDGIACDAHGRALGVDDVYAIGDVARWAPDGTGRGERVEHWHAAQAQARCLAENLLDPASPRTPGEVPMVWSDQHGHTVQILGRVDPATRPRVVEEPGRLVALWDEGDVLVGAVTISWPRAALTARRAIGAGGSASSVLDTLTVVAAR